MTKKKSFLLVGLATISVAALATGAGIVSSANAAEGWSETSFAAEYGYKSDFTLQKRTYTLGKNTYDATAVLCYPDGSVSAEETQTLSQVGTYTVKYSVQAGDKAYAAAESFCVQYPTYDVGNKSSVAYGTPATATHAGVVAKLAQNESLVFTQYIDFTEIKSEDVLVQGYVVPSTAQANDFTELVLTFTDSVDSSVYFQVHHYAYDWAYNTYIAANGQNQVPVGNNQTQGLHKDDGYGTWSYVSFKSVGQSGTVAPDETQFFVSMNYAEKKVYGQGYPDKKTEIIDLDDLTQMGEAWTGFPSGKARLSVSAYNYTGSSATICITEVAGIDDLQQTVYADTGKPVISVDEEYAENMPVALKGAQYAIPTATAYDAYAGECDVDVSVWFNYGMENAVNVSVRDGKFTTDKVGTYGIVYEARDKVGNVAEEVRWVVAYEKISDAEFALPSELPESVRIGEWVNVPDVDEETITGGSGKKTVQAYAEWNGARTEITDGGFRAEHIGVYRVVYVATDYVGKQTEKSCALTVTESDTPILEKDFDVQPIYVSGNEYVLPSYAVYSYENGALKKAACQVVVTDGAGTKTYTAGEKATLKVNENEDTIAFAVQYGGKTLATHEAKGILAWVQEDVGLRFHLENYFVGDGFEKEKTENGMVFEATGDDFSFAYANALSAEHISMEIGEFKNFTNNTRLRVRLRDAQNEDCYVLLTIGKNDKGVYAETAGGRVAIENADLETGSLSIEFLNNAFTVNGAACASTNFVGFESDKMILQIDSEGCGEKGGFNFKQLGNCPFSTARSDRIGPYLAAKTETGGTYQKGDKYTIVAPIAYDVYSPNMKYTLTVTAPNGEPMKDENGVTLNEVDPTKNYVVCLGDIGEYTVLYTAAESDEFLSRPNKITLQYTLKVSDEVAPTIGWNEAFPTELQVGSMFIVPQYTVSDNYTLAENIIVRVFVETPEGQLFMLPGNAIKMTHVGVYEVRVMVVDEAGNITNDIHHITVREGN